MAKSGKKARRAESAPEAAPEPGDSTAEAIEAEAIEAEAVAQVPEPPADEAVEEPAGELAGELAAAPAEALPETAEPGRNGLVELAAESPPGISVGPLVASVAAVERLDLLDEASPPSVDPPGVNEDPPPADPPPDAPPAVAETPAKAGLVRLHSRHRGKLRPYAKGDC